MGLVVLSQGPDDPCHFCVRLVSRRGHTSEMGEGEEICRI